MLIWRTRCDEMFSHIFSDYFERIMLLSSAAWSCSYTGRPDLTYQEALQSEKNARKTLKRFSKTIKIPAILLASFTKRSSIGEMVDDVFNYMISRYFVGETVDAIDSQGKKDFWVDAEVLEVIALKDTPVEPTDVQYRVKYLEDNDDKDSWTVHVTQIRRQRSHFSKGKIKLLLKQHIERADGMLKIKSESFKKLVTDENVSFDKIFIGKRPIFEVSKALQHKKEKKKLTNGTVKKSEPPTSNKKTTQESQGATKRKSKQTSIDSYLTPESNGTTKKQKQEKTKAMIEEMERIRKEKAEQEAERQRKLAEERQREKQEFNKMFVAANRFFSMSRDDLELQDQKLLPVPKSIKSLIPDKYFGDSLMILNFISSFSKVLTDKHKFLSNLNNLNINIMERAFTKREMAGPLSDVIQLLLNTVFTLQLDEEMELKNRFSAVSTKLLKPNSPTDIENVMLDASRAFNWSLKYLRSHIPNLPVDMTTVSEVLRLHLLSSGAIMRETFSSWRYQQRGGYQNSDDPGLMLRLEKPHILRALSHSTIFELPYRDIISVINCLIDQILTYASIRDIIDEHIADSFVLRNEIRSLIISEKRRELAYAESRKATLNEQGVTIDSTAESPGLDLLSSRKLGKMEVAADKAKKEFQKQLDKLTEKYLTTLTYLGCDRAYRSYWVFYSVPGLFVHHKPYKGKCYTDPVENINELSNCPSEEMYKTIKQIVLDYHKEHKGIKAEDVDFLKIKSNKNNLSTDNSTSNPSQKELLMCTGDIDKCLVHGLSNSERVNWSVYTTAEEIDALIKSLNTRGIRERNLRDQLEQCKDALINQVVHCPVERFQVTDENRERLLKDLRNMKLYSSSNKFVSNDLEVSSQMQISLRESILELEAFIFSGLLGNLKVEDRSKWREMLEEDSFDMQCSCIVWGPKSEYKMNRDGKLEKSSVDTKVTENGEKINGNSHGESSDSEEEKDDLDNDVSFDFEDPGSLLRKNQELSDCDSDDDIKPLVQSDVQKTVRCYATALLQIAQSIEQKFFKPPFGLSTKLNAKEQTNKQKLIEKCTTALGLWSVSLMNSTSFSQIYLHYNILYDSINWSKSVNNALCKVCRRKYDPELMLLCDNCNDGYHMYCLRPKISVSILFKSLLFYFFIYFIHCISEST